MAYTRGSSTNIIVGAASLFTYTTTLTEADLPAYTAAQSFREDLSDDTDFTNVGYTMNGLELQFQPDFGEVQVDQVLDVAKLYKQGMQVNMNTTFAEATLENLLVAIAGSNTDLSSLTGTGIGTGSKEFLINSGNLGECPVERGLVAVGPGRTMESGELKPVTIAVGDAVLLPEYGGTTIKMGADKEELVIYRDDDVPGILEEKISE